MRLADPRCRSRSRSRGKLTGFRCLTGARRFRATWGRLEARQVRMLHTAPHLQTRLAELMMSQLLPCDLGDGIEVLHEVEAIEVELECDVDDHPAIEVTDITERMERIWFESDDLGTHQFVRQSAPYERIELH